MVGWETRRSQMGPQTSQRMELAHLGKERVVEWEGQPGQCKGRRGKSRGEELVG